MYMYINAYIIQVLMSVHGAVGAHNPGAHGAYKCPWVSHGSLGVQGAHGALDI